MRWDTWKRLEDAWASYLRQVLPGSMLVYTSRDAEPAQFPRVRVGAGHARLVSTGELYAAMKFDGALIVEVEAAPETDGNGIVLKTADERDTALVSAVMDAVMVDNLTVQLNAQNVPGLTVTLCLPGAEDGAIMNPLEPDDRVYLTEIPWRAIASPKEI